MAALQALGVNIIVALSSTNFAFTGDFARLVSGIDVIVNDPDMWDGVYPHVYTAKDGKPVLVASSREFGRTMGVLNVTFNGAGDIVGWNGLQTELNTLVAMDNATATKLKVLEVNMVEQLKVSLSAATQSANGHPFDHPILH